MGLNLLLRLGGNVIPGPVGIIKQHRLISLQYFLTLLSLGERHIMIRRLPNIVDSIIINHTIKIKSPEQNVNT